MSNFIGEYLTWIKLQCGGQVITFNEHIKLTKHTWAPPLLSLSVEQAWGSTRTQSMLVEIKTCSFSAKPISRIEWPIEGWKRTKESIIFMGHISSDLHVVLVRSDRRHPINTLELLLPSPSGVLDLADWGRSGVEMAICVIHLVCYLNTTCIVVCFAGHDE